MTKLQRLISECGVSDTQLADELQIETAYIRALRDGKMQGSYNLREGIAAIFGVESDTLLIIERDN